MIKKTGSRGFTLIELLVVIAIIGILASVVLGSLNTARSRGADAAIKSQLSGLRAQAEIFYDANASTYAGGTSVVSTTAACPTAAATNAGANYSLFGDATFARAVIASDTQGGLCAWRNSGTEWAVAVQLKSDAKKAFCVDSFGNAKEIADAADYTATTLAGDLTATGCGA